MFNNYQLEVLQILAEKWKMWEQTQVSLFTHEDKLKIDELRASINLSPANIGCNVCFMEDVGQLITAYNTQLATETTVAVADESATQSGTDGGEGKKRGRKKK